MSGTGDREPADRPWDEPGAVRRDCAPHRGNLLSLLAGVALALAFLSFCLAPAGLLALGIAGVVQALARQDLGRMDAGRIDPVGREQAERARTLARAAVLLGVAGTMLCGLPALIVFLQLL